MVLLKTEKKDLFTWPGRFAGPVAAVVGLTIWCGFFVKRGIPPRVPLFPVVVVELIGIDDVWLLLGDERRFDMIGDWDTLVTERVGIALRLATVGTGDGGDSETDDVELVIDEVCWVRVGADGGTILVFGWVPFFAGVGMIVGRRIPPPVVDETDFSELVGGGGGGGDGSLIVGGAWRDFDWIFELISVTSVSGDETSKYSI